jgi:hypothetical protein
MAIAIQARRGGHTSGHVNKAGTHKPKLAPHKLPLVVTMDGMPCKWRLVKLPAKP